MTLLSQSVQCSQTPRRSHPIQCCQTQRLHWLYSVPQVLENTQCLQSLCKIMGSHRISKLSLTQAMQHLEGTQTHKIFLASSVFSCTWCIPASAVFSITWSTCATFSSQTPESSPSLQHVQTPALSRHLQCSQMLRLSQRLQCSQSHGLFLASFIILSHTT